MAKQRAPLNALRAFDAAARHLSLTRAARDLYVTHGAVSRQVQKLEQYLGRKLFIRGAKGLELTGDGRGLAFHSRSAFDELDEAIDAMRKRPLDRTLTLSTVPSVAARWLVPRIMHFQSEWDMEVRVSTTPRLVDFQDDGVDIAIRYGRGKWHGLHSERLFTPMEYPVCAPSLLDGKCALKSPHDLKRFTLLHETTRSHWRQWLQQADADEVDVSAGIVIEDINVLMQMAIEGHGVALVSGPLADADVAAGRLVRPFEIGIEVEPSYYIVCPREHLDRADVRCFISWLHCEAKKRPGEKCVKT